MEEGIKTDNGFTMIKTHKIALRPNRDQIAWFYQQCGYAKFAYNQSLFDFKTELASDNFLLTLSDRKPYHCSCCGASLDRDVNAALNLRTLAAGYAERENACGVRVIPRFEGVDDETRIPLL